MRGLGCGEKSREGKASTAKVKLHRDSSQKDTKVAFGSLTSPSLRGIQRVGSRDFAKLTLEIGLKKISKSRFSAIATRGLVAVCCLQRALLFFRELLVCLCYMHAQAKQGKESYCSSLSLVQGSTATLLQGFQAR